MVLDKDRYYSFLRSSEMSDVDDIVFDAIKVFNDDMNLEPIRNEKGKIDMCKASEELRKDFIAEGRAEGLMEGRAEAVMAAMKNFNLTAEEAMAGLEIPEEDRDGILRLLKNKI